MSEENVEVVRKAIAYEYDASHVPSREAVLGFLFGLAVLMIAYGILGDIPAVIAAAMIPLIFAGWIFFSIRDRIRGRRKTSALDDA